MRLIFDLLAWQVFGAAATDPSSRQHSGLRITSHRRRRAVNGARPRLLSGSGLTPGEG